MPARRKTPILERMAADLARQGGGRSPLTVWLQENRAGFAALIDRQGARWEVLAAVLRDEGLLDAKGDTPTAETLRGAWRRVQNRHERPATPRRRTSRPVSAQASAAPALAAVRVLAGDPQPVHAPAEASTRPSNRADEQIARLDKQLNAKKGRMPRPL